MGEGRDHRGTYSARTKVLGNSNTGSGGEDGEGLHGDAGGVREKGVEKMLQVSSGIRILRSLDDSAVDWACRE